MMSFINDSLTTSSTEDMSSSNYGTNASEFLELILNDSLYTTSSEKTFSSNSEADA